MNKEELKVVIEISNTLKLIEEDLKGIEYNTRK